MGKHEDPRGRTNNTRSAQEHQPKHSTVTGFKVGNQDRAKRGLGNAQGNENNR